MTSDDSKLEQSQDLDASDRLAHRRDEIIEIWCERLRYDVPPAKNLPEPFLRDSLPNWLDGLVRVLASPDPDKKFTVVEDKAKEHGRDRSSVEFDLNEVLYEFTLLRQVIFDTVERDGPLTVRQRDIIFDAIQQSMRASAEEFTKSQSQLQAKEILCSRKRSLLIEFFIAAAIVCLATLLQWLTWSFVQPYAFFLYYPAVVFSSLYGNAGAGVLLAAVLGRFLFVSPRLSFSFPDVSSFARWVTFFASASLIAWVTTAFRNSRKLTEEAYKQQQNAKQEAERLYRASVKSEQEFRAIFMLAAAGKAILDAETGRFIKVNPTFCKMLGYSEEELLKKTFLEITHPEERGWQSEQYKQSVDSHSKAWSQKRRYIKKSGEIIWVVVSGSVLPGGGGDGEPMRTIATIHDITDLKKAQEDLQTTVVRLNEERALREQFVAMLSHDLRTPLTSAKLSVDLLLKYPERIDSIARMGQRARRSLDHADKMIQDLLDANRIQAGQPIPLEIQPTDIAQTLVELVEEMTILHGDRFRMEGPKRLEGDWNALALRRIAENLITNAVKYGDSSKLITIKLFEGSEQVEFSVHNFGKPISEEERARLFKIFHRSESAVRSGKIGWGIGLTLVRGLTEALRGKISVESSLESGTTFRVTVPRDSNASTSGT